MKHSKAFAEAKDELRQRETELKQQIDEDAEVLLKSGKKLVLFLGGTFVALIIGKMFFGRSTSMKGSKRSYRWMGRLLEFFIPFIFTSLVKYQAGRKKEISDS